MRQVLQSHNSNLIMSEPGVTRVNVTNPFTDTRHHRHPDHSNLIAQPFDPQYQDNSYTYTLQQPIAEQQFAQPHQQAHFLHGNKPYTETSYDEEDDSSDSSSEVTDGEDCSDESSLTDY